MHISGCGGGSGCGAFHCLPLGLLGLLLRLRRSNLFATVFLTLSLLQSNQQDWHLSGYLCLLVHKQRV